MKRKEHKYLMHLLRIHQEVCCARIQRKGFTAPNVRKCLWQPQTGGVCSFWQIEVKGRGAEFVSHCWIQGHSYTHGIMFLCVFGSLSVYRY